MKEVRLGGGILSWWVSSIRSFITSRVPSTFTRRHQPLSFCPFKVSLIHHRVQFNSHCTINRVQAFPTMGVKRKRSFDSSPASIASITASSCRESTSPTPMPRQLPESVMEMDVPGNTLGSPTWCRDRTDHLVAKLNSRTRKRWRDNRPDDTIIHRMLSWNHSLVLATNRSVCRKYHRHALCRPTSAP